MSGHVNPRERIGYILPNIYCWKSLKCLYTLENISVATEDTNRKLVSYFSIVARIINPYSVPKGTYFLKKIESGSIVSKIVLPPNTFLFLTNIKTSRTQLPRTPSNTPRKLSGG